LESIREKTKESGFSLMEAMVVLALLGLLAAFAGLSMAWYPAQQKSAPTQAAYFLFAALEEARRLERFYGRDVFLSWETDGFGCNS